MLALRPACLHGPLESYQVYLSFRAEPCLTPPALPYPYFIRYLIPGGSAGHFKREGYTFDVGSSMMFGFGEQGTTNLITKCLEAVGKKMETVADPTQVSATGRSRGGACGGEGKAIGCVVSRWSGRSQVHKHNVSSHTLPALFPHPACSPYLARFPPSGLNRGKQGEKADLRRQSAISCLSATETRDSPVPCYGGYPPPPSSGLLPLAQE